MEEERRHHVYYHRVSGRQVPAVEMQRRRLFWLVLGLVAATTAVFMAGAQSILDTDNEYVNADFVTDHRRQQLDGDEEAQWVGVLEKLLKRQSGRPASVEVRRRRYRTAPPITTKDDLTTVMAANKNEVDHDAADHDDGAGLIYSPYRARRWQWHPDRYCRHLLWLMKYNKEAAMKILKKYPALAPRFFRHLVFCGRKPRVVRIYKDVIPGGVHIMDVTTTTSTSTTTTTTSTPAPPTTTTRPCHLPPKKVYEVVLKPKVPCKVFTTTSHNSSAAIVSRPILKRTWYIKGEKDDVISGKLQHPYLVSKCDKTGKCHTVLKFICRTTKVKGVICQPLEFIREMLRDPVAAPLVRRLIAILAAQKNITLPAALRREARAGGDVDKILSKLLRIAAKNKKYNVVFKPAGAGDMYQRDDDDDDDDDDELRRRVDEDDDDRYLRRPRGDEDDDDRYLRRPRGVVVPEETETDEDDRPSTPAVDIGRADLSELVNTIASYSPAVRDEGSDDTTTADDEPSGAAFLKALAWGDEGDDDTAAANVETTEDDTNNVYDAARRTTTTTTAHGECPDGGMCSCAGGVCTCPDATRCTPNDTYTEDHLVIEEPTKIEVPDVPAVITSVPEPEPEPEPTPQPVPEHHHHHYYYQKDHHHHHTTDHHHHYTTSVVEKQRPQKILLGEVKTYVQWKRVFPTYFCDQANNGTGIWVTRVTPQCNGLQSFGPVEARRHGNFLSQYYWNNSAPVQQPQRSVMFVVQDEDERNMSPHCLRTYDNYLSGLVRSPVDLNQHQVLGAATTVPERMAVAADDWATAPQNYPVAKSPVSDVFIIPPASGKPYMSPVFNSPEMKDSKIWVSDGQNFNDMKDFAVQAVAGDRVDGESLAMARQALPVQFGGLNTTFPRNSGMENDMWRFVRATNDAPAGDDDADFMGDN